jgi:hypothetical protein
LIERRIDPRTGHNRQCRTCTASPSIAAWRAPRIQRRRRAGRGHDVSDAGLEILAEERNYEGLGRPNAALIEHAAIQSPTRRVTWISTAPRPGIDRSSPSTRAAIASWPTSGRIVTTLTGRTGRLSASNNQRRTAEQWIKEGQRSHPATTLGGTASRPTRCGKPSTPARPALRHSRAGPSRVSSRAGRVVEQDFR